MIRKDSILEILDENEKTIKRFGVKRIGVFGSFARRAHTENSDLDILVEFKKGQKTFDHYIGLKEVLEKLFNRKVDLVIKEAIKPRIKSVILRETRYAGL